MNPVEDRFWSKVEFGDWLDCWPWTGTENGKGYGTLTIERRKRYAHRVAYELLVGPIPDGLVIDHLCRVRGCVNPLHMEPVTNRENLLRGVGQTATNAAKIRCKWGHPFDQENTIRDNEGFRRCRTCKILYLRRYRAERRPTT